MCSALCLLTLMNIVIPAFKENCYICCFGIYVFRSMSVDFDEYRYSSF